MFHICFAADENYIKYTAVLITSIIKSTDTSRKFKDFFTQNSAAQSVAGGGDFENSKQPSKPTNNGLSAYKKLDYATLIDDEKAEGYVFHILTDKISENSRQRLENLAQKLSEIYPCEIQTHICENLPPRANNEHCFRLFIINFMPSDLKMCLYLDGDMLARQDLRALFTLDLSGKLAGVIKENVWVVRKAHEKTGLFKGFYFNSGFLLMNLRAWGEQNALDKCLEFLNKYGDRVLYQDQDALNYAISQDKALVLPFGYNLFAGIYANAICKDDRKKFAIDYTRAELNFALANPAIWHFVGVEKPWRNPYIFTDCKGKALGLFWWDIALQTPIFRDKFESDFDTLQKAILPQLAFQNYVIALILRCSQSFLGYFKMPFVVAKAFKDKENGEFDASKASDLTPKFSPNEQNLGLMLFSVAKNAWEKRLKGRLLDLPHRVWRLKLRFERYGSAKILAESGLVFG